MMDPAEAASVLRMLQEDLDALPFLDPPVGDAVKAIVDFVESIPPDRLSPWHTVTVQATGWHMAHPITCDLAVCPFDGLAQAEWTDPPTAEGIWQWHDFDDEPWSWVLDNADYDGVES